MMTVNEEMIEKPVAWRWRYIYPGRVNHWVLRASPIKASAATSDCVAVEVEPLYIRAYNPNERLTARIAELEGTVATAAKTFRRYAELHRMKGTTEGNLKASNNDDLAEFCESALFEQRR